MYVRKVLIYAWRNRILILIDTNEHKEFEKIKKLEKNKDWRIRFAKI